MRSRRGIAPVAVPQFGSPVELDEVVVPLDELGKIADRLDERFGQTHRRASLDRLLGHLHTGNGVAMRGADLTVTAGLIRVLNTGSGKSVLTTLLAIWCVSKNLVTTIVVPRNDTVFKFTTQLRRELAALDHTGTVVPLISPNSMQEEAEKGARLHTDADRPDEAAGVFGEFAYGCPLAASSTNMQDVDLWRPGDEPCTRLIGPDPETGEPTRHRCPWHGRCGKHRHQVALGGADIIVTTHINLLIGRIQMPVIADGAIRQVVSVEEAILHLSHLVLIDEVDAFQATAFDKSAHHVTLARYGSRKPTALQELDEQFRAREGQLLYELERHLHPKITQARFLSESYVSNAAHGHIVQTNPQDRRSKQPSRRRLVIPRRWDAWCCQMLWRLGERVVPERSQISTFRWLFDPSQDANGKNLDTLDEIPDVAGSRQKLAQLRRLILDTTVLQDGQDPIYAGAHKKITAAVEPLLAPWVSRADRTLLIDLIVRRAYLEQIRAQVTYMTRSGRLLQASGITATNELVEMLDNNQQWRAAPYGPLGHHVFGFNAAHDVDDPYRSELALTSFTGDPHAYTVTLGDVTALALCGTRRIVIGLSATAYMPGGTMHHLIAEPTWFVPDDITGRLVLKPLILEDEDGQGIRISGTSDI